MIHGSHVTVLDDAVLFRELGFGEGLSVAVVSGLLALLMVLACQQKHADGLRSRWRSHQSSCP